MLQLWEDATHRDDDTTTILINGGTDCYVLGRGEGAEGAWSINAGADANVCHQLGDELGGRSSRPEDDPGPSGPPPAPTYTLSDLQSMAGTPCPAPGATAQAPDSTVGYSTSAFEVGLVCAGGTWSVRGEPLGGCEFLYEDLPYATADQQRLTCVDGGLFLDGQTRTGPLYVGDYLVGTGTGQVPPGTYVATDVEGCYWERLDAAGNIIDNNFINAAPRAEFTVRASDYALNINGCGGWMRAGG